MFKIVRELQQTGTLEYSKDEGFTVIDDEIRISYENMTGQKDSTISEGKQSSEYVDWLQAWIDGNERCGGV